MIRVASLNVLINYSQIILHLPSVERPGHIWGNAELDQGFAWSPGVVSLKVPEHALVCLVDIDIVTEFKVSPDAISCVCMPFKINENPVYVGSVFFYDPVNVEFGDYNLYYEVLQGEGMAMIEDGSQPQSFDIDYFLKISLVEGEESDFRIVKFGGVVCCDKVLRRLSELA